MDKPVMGQVQDTESTPSAVVEFSKGRLNFKVPAAEAAGPVCYSCYRCILTCRACRVVCYTCIKSA